MPYNFLKRVTAVSFLSATVHHKIQHTVCTNNGLMSHQNATQTNRSFQDHFPTSIWKYRFQNKLRKEMLCELCVLISVYLWRKGERTVTVFQPTEIRRNTGSVSYPKGKENVAESRDKSQGIQRGLGRRRQLTSVNVSRRCCC